MEEIKLIGVIVFITLLLLNVGTVSVNFMSLKTEAILDEIKLLMLVIGLNFWVIGSVLERVETGYKGIIIVMISAFVGFGISRVSVLVGRRKQLIEDLLETTSNRVKGE